LWRKHLWFSIRYPVNFTNNLTWITEFNKYLDEVNELRNKLK